MPLIRQVKLLELKIKEKETLISEGKKELEEERNQRTKDQEVVLLRLKKQKNDHEEQIEGYLKTEKELKDRIQE